MNVQNLEYIFSLSLQNNQEAIQEAERQLITIIQTPDSIPLFLQIIQNANNPSYIKASFIYLEKAISFLWPNFTQEQKINLQTLIFNIYFHSQTHKMQFAYIIKYFLQNTDNLDSFIPFLTKEINQDNIFMMINLYSSIIQSLPLPLLGKLKNYIVNLVLACFNSTKDMQNNSDIVDVKISTFHVSTVLSFKFNDIGIVVPQIQSMVFILFNSELEDSSYTMIFKLFEQVLPNLLNSSELQNLFYNTAIAFAENQTISKYRRSIAFQLILKQMENKVIQPNQVFHLIDIAFDLLVLEIQNVEPSQTDLIKTIVYANFIVPEKDICLYLSKIEEKAFKTNSVDYITSGIIIIYILILYYPEYVHENQKQIVQILSNFLDHSLPVSFQIAALSAIMQTNISYTLFPQVFPKKIITHIFYSPYHNVSLAAINAFFVLANYKQFNHQEMFAIVWSNRVEFMKRQPRYFMEMIFGLCMWIDDLPQEVREEMYKLVLHFLNPETETSLLSSTLNLAVSLFLFNEQPNPEILMRIYCLIEKSLQMQDFDLFCTIMNFLFIFVTQLKEHSFEYLKNYAESIINAVIQNEVEQTLSLGAAIVKYWRCVQIKPIIYKRIVALMKKAKILFINDDDDINQIIESNENENGDKNRHNFLFQENFSYFKIIYFLVKYLEPEEANELFFLCIKSFNIYHEEILPLLKELVDNVHPQNYEKFISAFSSLVKSSLDPSNNDIYVLTYELSEHFFALPTEETANLFANLIQSLTTVIKDPQFSYEQKDTFIGICIDAVHYHKVLQEQVKDLFLLIYSLVFQNVPVMMWQNISFFFNICITSYPYLLNFPEIQSTFKQFLQVLAMWMKTPSSEEFDMSDTHDTIASMFLTIISCAKINNEDILNESLVFFPPGDITETKCMVTRIIEIYQMSPPLKSCCIMADAIVRFFTMALKKKRRIEVDSDRINKLGLILKQMLSNHEILKYILMQNQNFPERIEFVTKIIQK